MQVCQWKSVEFTSVIQNLNGQVVQVAAEIFGRRKIDRSIGVHTL